MGATRNHITNRLGKKLGQNADGDLQVCFASSKRSHYWFFVTNAANINKWSPRKPFRVNMRFRDHYDDANSQRLAQLKLANYGLSIPAIPYSDINSMVAGMANNDWVYLNPRGTAYNEPLRAQDFESYDGEAPAPIYPIQSITDLTSAESTMSAGLGFGRNIAAQGYITLDDLHINGHSISDNFGEWYFGICLYYSNTVRYASTMADKYKTIQASLSEIGLSVRNVSVPGSGSRIYRAIPFFASIPFDTMPSNYQGSLYPIPFAECQLRITRTQDPYIMVLMYSLMNDTSDKLYYQYKIVNPTNTQRTYTVNVWALRSYNINDTYGSVVRTDNSISVSANSSYTLPLQTITDGIRVRDILANAPFVGAEMRVGEPRVGYSISSIIIDADPNDPPSF